SLLLPLSMLLVRPRSSLFPYTTLFRSFSFYQFFPAPVFFNKKEIHQLSKTEYAPQLSAYQSTYARLQEEKQTDVRHLVAAMKQDDEAATHQFQTTILEKQSEMDSVRGRVKKLMLKNNAFAEHD